MCMHEKETAVTEELKSCLRYGDLLAINDKNEDANGIYIQDSAYSPESATGVRQGQGWTPPCVGASGLEVVDLKISKI